MPPFPAKEQLCDDLGIDPIPTSETRILVGRVNRKGTVFLPGYPLINANDGPTVNRHLRRELLTPELDDLSQFFFFVSTPDSAHISPVHEQLARGRTIVVSENPGLHLLWYDDRVFLKPVPSCLLSYAVWALYVDGSSAESSALGFVRTYAYLIRSRLDYNLALQYELLPGLSATDDDFERLLHFLHMFLDVKDERVNARYRYGELRLSRVNVMARLFRFRYFYYDVHNQYSNYFARYIGPLVFIFGTITVALSAMQVELAVEQLADTGHRGGFVRLSRWYSVACMALVFIALACFPLLWIMFLLGELTWTIRFVMKKAKKRVSRKQVV